jgi:hypothetical protein
LIGQDPNGLSLTDFHHSTAAGDRKYCTNRRFGRFDWPGGRPTLGRGLFRGWAVVELGRKDLKVKAGLLAVFGTALVMTAGANASSLRVIGSGQSAGDFAVTSADASKRNAHAIYVRGYGRGLAAYAVVSCSRGISSIGSRSTDLSGMRSGQLYSLRLPFAGDCNVVASLSGSGSIRLQILA